MTEHIITGATGFVGGHLLADLLLDADTTAVHAVARATGGRTPGDRVWDNLSDNGFDGSAERLTVVDGDLTEERCGVEPGAITRGDGPVVFWHLAASLQWRRGQREQIFRTNVEGTRQALELAKSLGADLFVYVSTAYTCGSLHGDLPEALHEPPAFSNAYEESKCAAEHVVAGSEGVRTLILRPSVVVGTSTNYQPSGSYTGLYGYISEMRRFKKMMGDSEEIVRFSVDRATRISFIPVDHVVADMRAVVRTELAEPARSIYHVTARSEATVGGILDYILKLLGLQDRLVVVEETVENPTTLERMVDKRVEFFSDYLRNEKRFVRSIGPDRVLFGHEIEKYVDAESTL